MKRVVVYKLDTSSTTEQADFEFGVLKPVIWYPSYSNFIPPRKNKKYFIYWLFHYFRIFKNRNYGSLFIYANGKIISSLLIVPAHFKWPFMKSNDIQFTYIITDPAFRGKGIAEKALRFAIKTYKQQGRTFWYVTDTGNISSIKLCTKISFTFAGYGKTTSLLKILKLDD